MLLEGRWRLTVATEATLMCAHCGAGAGRGGVEDDAGHCFCCYGCKSAYETIHACGLSDFYAIRDRLGSAEGDRVPPAESGDDFEYMGDEAFLSQRCTMQSDGMLRTELLVEGMHCAACIWLIERLPEQLPGLLEARVDLGRSLVLIRFDPERMTLPRIARSLSMLGYGPRSVEPSSQRAARRQEERKGLVRIGIAGACAGNLMLLAFALYSGTADSIAHPYFTLFRWLSLGLGVLTVFGPGRVFLSGAIGAIRMRLWHLDMPIAMALLVGVIGGAINTIRGAGEIYFDSIGMLVFLLLVGRWLQTKQQRRAHDAVELLFSVTPSKAHRVDASGAVVDAAVESLDVGDVVEVRAGERIPVDGVVVEGTSSLSDSILTGESRPHEVSCGDRVCAGEVNLASIVRIQVAAVGRQTRIGQMMDLIEDLARRRVPIIGTADRLARPFVVTVTSLACLALVLHIGAGLAIAVEHAVALLIVCCPCALALATPLASTVAIGQAATRKILVKGGDVLEVLGGRPGHVLLDKTGTVTTGTYELIEWCGADVYLPVVATLEEGSVHPVALALVGACDERVDVADVRHEIGRGVRGRWAGREVRVGSRAFVEEVGADVSGARSALSDGSLVTPVYVSVDGVCVGAAYCGDRMRDEAVGLVSELRGLGWTVGMLSGDDPDVVDAVGAQLGLDPGDIRGGVSPEEKHDVVRTSLDPTRVVMIGDGVNDAAALAAAGVGIAVRGGAEVSLAASDVYLGTPGIDGVVSLIKASRRTLTTIRRCIGLAIGYNVLAAGCAVAGLITPLAAAVLMPISSMTVIAIALRSRPFGSVR